MTKEDMIALLEKLPPGTEIYSRQGDNAWPAKLRVFQEPAIVAYITINANDHRNFPEGYSGVKEITKEILG